MKQLSKIVIYSDGGARGNPGPAGIGVVIKIDNQDNQEIKREKKISEFIGTATNNQAEYKAVIAALSYIQENRDDKDFSENLEIECFLDSKLVVEQLNQNYKLKNEGLKPLFWQARDLVLKLGGSTNSPQGGKVSFQYIPREQNQEADRLVNQALDNQEN